MEMGVDSPCSFAADTGRPLKIAQASHLYPAGRTEVVEQGPLSRRTDTLYFIELTSTDRLGTSRPMGRDGEAVGLVS